MNLFDTISFCYTVSSPCNLRDVYLNFNCIDLSIKLLVYSAIIILSITLYLTYRNVSHNLILRVWVHLYFSHSYVKWNIMLLCVHIFPCRCSLLFMARFLRTCFKMFKKMYLKKRNIQEIISLKIVLNIWLKAPRNYVKYIILPQNTAPCRMTHDMGQIIMPSGIDAYLNSTIHVVSNNTTTMVSRNVDWHLMFCYTEPINNDIVI